MAPPSRPSHWIFQSDHRSRRVATFNCHATLHFLRCRHRVLMFTAQRNHVDRALGSNPISFSDCWAGDAASTDNARRESQVASFPVTIYSSAQSRSRDRCRSTGDRTAKVTPSARRSPTACQYQIGKKWFEVSQRFLLRNAGKRNIECCWQRFWWFG